MEETEISEEKLKILAGMGMRKIGGGRSGGGGTIPNGAARIYGTGKKKGHKPEGVRLALGLDLRRRLGITDPKFACRVDVFYTDDKICIMKNAMGDYSCKGGYVSLTKLDRIMKLQSGTYNARWDARISAVIVHLERPVGPSVSEAVALPKKQERTTPTHDELYKERLNTLSIGKYFRTVDLPNPPSTAVWTRFVAEALRRGDVEHVGPCQYRRKILIPFSVIEDSQTKEEEGRRRGEMIAEVRKAEL